LTFDVISRIAHFLGCHPPTGRGQHKKTEHAPKGDQPHKQPGFGRPEGPGQGQQPLRLSGPCGSTRCRVSKTELVVTVKGFSEISGTRHSGLGGRSGQGPFGITLLPYLGATWPVLSSLFRQNACWLPTKNPTLRSGGGNGMRSGGFKLAKCRRSADVCLRPAQPSGSCLPVS